MNNLFQYTKTEGQGWLVEKPGREKPVMDKEFEMYEAAVEQFISDNAEYNRHLATLRRFKYDYPDPKKEMELGKDFEVMINHLDQKEWRAIPITRRTYSEQDLLDTWNGGYDRAWDVSKGDLTGGGSKNQQEFFKTRFGIEIK